MAAKNTGLLRNKKGDISVLLLVFLLLFLVTYVMFLFVTRTGKVDASMGDARFLESTFYEEGQARFYLTSAAEKAIARSYIEIANEKGQMVLNNFDEATMNLLLKDKMSANFEVEKSKYNLRDIKVQSISVSGEIVDIEFSDFPVLADLSDSKGNLIAKAIYRPSMKIRLNITERGLNSFGQINSARGVCGALEKIDEIQGCFNRELPNFDARVEQMGKEGEKVAYLVSKKRFLIESLLKSVDIGIKV